MKIERVDDKTVKCFLSNEELEEYDIDYKDFVLRSDKAREVVQDIIVQAEEEVGYKPPRYAFDLQIMMMPDQGLLLTLSEKEPVDLKDGEQILECLKDMKQILERTREKIGDGKEALQKQERTPSENGETAAKKKGQSARPEEAVFAFDNISAIMSFAAAMPANLRVISALYFLNGVYYLYLEKGGASYERYSRTCIQAMEFGTLYAADRSVLLYLQEHGECVIAERALKKLCMEPKKP